MKSKKTVAAIGRQGRLLVARFFPGTDLVEGIIELMKTNSISSCTVTAIGSLRAAKVAWAGTMEFGDNPMDAAVFHEMQGPVELGVAQGVCGTDEEGEVVMHLHALIMDKHGNMRCGNLVPGSAPVLATVDLTMQEFEGLELKPTYDPEWKHRFLLPGVVQRT